VQVYALFFCSESLYCIVHTLKQVIQRFSCAVDSHAVGCCDKNYVKWHLNRVYLGPLLLKPFSDDMVSIVQPVGLTFTK
jgi:hypothetical protein